MDRSNTQPNNKKKEHNSTKYQLLSDDEKLDLLNKLRADYLCNPNLSKQIQLKGLLARFSESNECKEIYLKVIMNCVWRIYLAPEPGPYFITTDNPGTSIQNGVNYNTKFNEGFQFFLPLSPRICLVITDLKKDYMYDKKIVTKTIQYVSVSTQTVIHINDKLIQQLNRLIIGIEKWNLDIFIANNKPKYES